MPQNETPTPNTPHNYRGRFAPSPTGPLHFGSLVSALGSYLQARSQRGEWLVRMEDIDPPREQAGAADDILRTLEAYQLHWDGPIRYQSQRRESYLGALEQLAKQGDTFPCSCTRTSITKAITKAATKTMTTTGAPSQQTSQPTPANPGNERQNIYPGTCRAGLPTGTTARAIRLRVPTINDIFTDAVQGLQTTSLDTAIGDFIVRRADGLFAYHLAVVVDDAEQQITEIVRGTDLLPSTPPQRYLQTCLGYAHPSYYHLPVASNQAGQKLSKQTFASAINTHSVSPTLIRALEFLGQQPDAQLASASPADILAWAIEHWNFQDIPRSTSIIVDSNLCQQPRNNAN